MPIRGAKNPFPKMTKPTNSGIFSDSGKGQKMDPVRRPSPIPKTLAEAYRANRKRGD
jgi:hypothetical protein